MSFLLRFALSFALVWILPLQAMGQALPQLGDPDSDELSLASEKRLGEFTMREIRRDPAYVGDAELHDYLNDLLQKLAQTPQGRRASVEGFFVRDGSLNAFALPGGFIGVHTGLMLAAQTDSEVAAVLGHEIGHVIQRHLARMLAQQKQATLATLAGLVLAGLAARAGNLDGAAGLATLGSSISMQQQLAFSRNAEREADRIGIEITRDAGFSANGLVDFFQRLQTASRAYESNAPAYLRTHPLTTERIGDVQSRLLTERYKQVPPTLDFELVKARLRVEQDGSTQALLSAQKYYEVALADRRLDAIVANVGLAHSHLALRQFAQAQRALDAAKLALQAVRAHHPFIERLSIAVAAARGEHAQAITIGKKANELFPNSRAIAHELASAYLAAKQPNQAAKFLGDWLAVRKLDDAAWALLGDAQEQLAKKASAGYSYAQSAAIRQNWPAAVASLQQAQRARDADYVLGSVIDTQLRDFRARMELDKKDAKELGLKK